MLDRKLIVAGLSATMQGIVSGVWSGLGRSCGNIIGGVIYTYFGPKWLFALTATWAAFGLSFFFMSEQIMRCMEESGRDNPGEKLLKEKLEVLSESDLDAISSSFDSASDLPSD